MLLTNSAPSMLLPLRESLSILRKLTHYIYPVFITSHHPIGRFIVLYHQCDFLFQTSSHMTLLAELSRMTHLSAAAAFSLNSHSTTHLFYSTTHSTPTSIMSEKICLAVMLLTSLQSPILIKACNVTSIAVCGQSGQPFSKWLLPVFYILAVPL